MSHRYLVLGLLAEGPMTGYEIKKRIGTALQSVTNASYGTLYPTLHRLLQEQAVYMEEHPQAHRPARKVYQITERGRRELELWLRQPAEADQVRREFLLKLFLARNLPPDELKALLQQRQRQAIAQLEALLQTDTKDREGMPINQTWVRDYTIEIMQAELNWLNRLMQQLEAVAVAG